MYHFQQKQKVCVFSLWVSFFMLFCRCLTFNSIHLNWQKPKYLPTSKWQQRTQHKIIIFRFFFLFSSEFFFCFVLFLQCPRIQWQKAFNYISPQSELSEKKTISNSEPLLFNLFKLERCFLFRFFGILAKMFAKGNYTHANTSKFVRYQQTDKQLLRFI